MRSGGQPVVPGRPVARGGDTAGGTPSETKRRKWKNEKKKTKKWKKEGKKGENLHKIQFLLHVKFVKCEMIARV